MFWTFSVHYRCGCYCELCCWCILVWIIYFFFFYSLCILHAKHVLPITLNVLFVWCLCHLCALVGTVQSLFLCFQIHDVYGLKIFFHCESLPLLVHDLTFGCKVHTQALAIGTDCDNTMCPFRLKNFQKQVLCKLVKDYFCLQWVSVWFLSLVQTSWQTLKPHSKHT